MARREILGAIQDAVDLGSRCEVACASIGLCVRRHQRWRRSIEDRRQGGARALQKLSEAEKDEIVAAYDDPRWRHLPVRSAWVKMVDEGFSLCSPATAYRVLSERDKRERLCVTRARPQRRPPVLEATAPNQVWTWDITYLPTHIRGAYLYLYTIQDLFSRRIVAWEVHATESGNLARDLFDRALSRVPEPWALHVHSDNGAPMRAKSLKALFELLEIRSTHGRPHQSNDNAFVESLFATLKGRASFPEYFRSLTEARSYVEALVRWYNECHMHSRLDYLTPVEMDEGKGPEIQARRNAVLERARALRPSRFGSKQLRFRVPTSVRLTFHETVAYT